MMMLERLARVFRGRESVPPLFVREPSPAPAPKPGPNHKPVPASPAPADSWADPAPRHAIHDQVHIPARHYRPAVKTAVTVEGAIDLFMAWTNDQGITGYFTKGEIDELWLTAQTELDIADIEPAFIRSALAGRGLRLGQVRIMGPQFAEVRHRTGKTRATLFHIPLETGLATLSPPSHHPLTGNSPASHRLATSQPATHRQVTGKQAVSAKTSVNPKQIAA